MIDDLLYHLAYLLRTAFRLDKKEQWEMLIPDSQPKKPEIKLVEPQYEIATPRQICQYQNLAPWLLTPDKQQLTRWRGMEQAYSLQILEIIAVDGNKVIRFTKLFYSQIIHAIRSAMEQNNNDYESVIKETLSSFILPKVLQQTELESLAEIVNFAAHNGAFRFDNYDRQFLTALAESR